MVCRKRKLSVEIKSNIRDKCLAVLFIDKFKYNENVIEKKKILYDLEIRLLL